MKHQRTIDKVVGGTFTRSELVTLRANAVTLQGRGDVDAALVIRAIDNASPMDKSMVFMGFCPGADFDNRLDIEWRAKGICTFTFLDSDQQVARFNDIWPGDLVILKKRHKFGETMLLYGHGRVTGVRYNDQGDRYLEMQWSPQDEIIEVPLMACNSTVDVRSIERVESEMPPAFFAWLGHDQQS